MSKFSITARPSMWWMVLLLVPFAGILWAPLFSQADPEMWGIPFFIWYQLLWVVLSALVTSLVFFKAAPRLRPIRR